MKKTNATSFGRYWNEVEGINKTHTRNGILYNLDCKVLFDYLVKIGMEDIRNNNSIVHKNDNDNEDEERIFLFKKKII